MITGFHEPQATHLAMVEQVIVAAGGRSLFHLLRAYREAQEAGTCGTSSVTHTRSLAVEAGLKTRLRHFRFCYFPAAFHSSAFVCGAADVWTLM